MDDFYTYGGGSKLATVVATYDHPCKPCYKEKNKKKYAKYGHKRRSESLARYHADPLSVRNSVLKRKYGMDSGEYERLYGSQNGCCAICATHKAGVGRDRLVVDHDHSSGAIRGLLCHKCNRGIGFLNDNAALLFEAADYLERN